MSGATSSSANPAELSQLRLTARGRALLLASGLVVALSLVSASTALGSNAASGGKKAPAAANLGYYEVITVLPGETLWSIAGQIDGEGDRADLVATIIDINGLTSSSLQVGQELRVPATQK